MAATDVRESDAMTKGCPLCGGVLEEGIAGVHGSLFGWFMAGWSYQQLWYRPHGGEERVVLESCESRPGWRCVDCNFVGVASPAPKTSPAGHKQFGKWRTWGT